MSGHLQASVFLMFLLLWVKVCVVFIGVRNTAITTLTELCQLLYLRFLSLHIELVKYWVRFSREKKNQSLVKDLFVYKGALIILADEDFKRNLEKYRLHTNCFNTKCSHDKEDRPMARPTIDMVLLWCINTRWGETALKQRSEIQK
jgi:hypothetical protein